MPSECAALFHNHVDQVTKRLSFVLVITWASECSNSELVETFLEWGNNIFSLDQVLVSPTRANMNLPNYKDLFERQLAQVSGVFFCGGDQARIVSLFGEVEGLKESLLARYNSGVPFAGTSAGAALMSHTMITGVLLARSLKPYVTYT